MPIIPGATTHPTILLLNCRSKALITKTHPALRNLRTRIRNQPRHVAMRRSQPRRKIRKNGSESVNGNKTNKPRPLVTTLRPQKRKRKGVTPARSCISIAIKKIIMQTTAPSLKKTSVGLGNFRAGD